MSKALEERMWYLRRFYGRGGWMQPRMTEVKKWRECFERLLKNGFLEKDGDHDLYRITDAGLAALSGLDARLKSASAR